MSGGISWFDKGITIVRFALEMINGLACFQVLLQFILYILAKQNLSFGVIFIFPIPKPFLPPSIFSNQITSKLFSSSFDLSAVFNLSRPMLIIYSCPPGLPATLLLCLEFSHSVAWILSFSLYVIFFSKSLLVIIFKISAKVPSSWQFTQKQSVSLGCFMVHTQAHTHTKGKKEKLSYFA